MTNNSIMNKILKYTKTAVAIIIFGLSTSFIGFVCGSYSQQNKDTQERKDRTIAIQSNRNSLNKTNGIININETRLKYNVPSLKTDDVLDKIAQERVEDTIKGGCNHDLLAEKRNKYFVTSVVGEIISCDKSNFQDIMTSFLESPTHNEILLNPKGKNMGIGISGNNLVVWITFDK